MKTLFKTFAYAAIAALALSSCAKENLKPADEITGKLVTVHFGTENTDPSTTRATLTPVAEETAFQAAWEDGDVLSIEYISPEANTAVIDGTWDETNKKFSATLPNETGAWAYVAAYPVPSASDNSIDFGANRTQKGNAYNSKYDIMIGAVDTKNSAAGKDDEGKDIVFPMTRQTAIAYFHFTSALDEKITSATLTVSGEGSAIASSDAHVSNFKWAPSKDCKSITITFPDEAPNAQDFKLWFNVLETSYESMSLTVETETKTFTISKASLGKYVAGKLYKVSKSVEFKAKPVVLSVSLTNDEITNVLKEHTGKAAYTTVDISSESGIWTGFMYSASTLTYVQLKAKEKSYLLSPEFSQAVKYVKINTASQITSDRSFYVIPSTTELPSTGEYGESSFDTIYGKSDKTVAGEQELTIALTGDPKQFMIVAMGGAVYINSIDVFFGELPSVAVEGVALNQKTLSLSKGDAATLEPVFTPSNATNKKVTWSSDNGDVATVDNGVVTAIAEGTATITVTTEDGGYTASCTVNVTKGGETNTWKLVTDASTLAAGDQLIIVCSSKKFAAGAISSSAMGKVAVTITNNEITSLPIDVVVLTLGGTSGSWTLANSEGKLLGATAVKKVAWGSGTTKWSISIDNNSATIQNETSTYGRFFYNVDSPRFTTYTSKTAANMLLPELYRYE